MSDSMSYVQSQRVALSGRMRPECHLLSLRAPQISEYIAAAFGVFYFTAHLLLLLFSCLVVGHIEFDG